jgi:hypothetical protein
LQPGQYVLADKAYDADWIREMIWEQGAIDVIPPKVNRKLPAEFDADIIESAIRSHGSLTDSKPLSAALRFETRRPHATFWR